MKDAAPHLALLVATRFDVVSREVLRGRPRSCVVCDAPARYRLHLLTGSSLCACGGCAGTFTDAGSRRAS